MSTGRELIGSVIGLTAISKLPFVAKAVELQDELSIEEKEDLWNLNYNRLLKFRGYYTFRGHGLIETTKLVAVKKLDDTIFFTFEPLQITVPVVVMIGMGVCTPKYRRVLDQPSFSICTSGTILKATAQITMEKYHR